MAELATAVIGSADFSLSQKSDALVLTYGRLLLIDEREKNADAAAADWMGAQYWHRQWLLSKGKPPEQLAKQETSFAPQKLIHFIYSLDHSDHGKGPAFMAGEPEPVAKIRVPTTEPSPGHVIVVDEAGQPVRGAGVMASTASTNTKRIMTNDAGEATVPINFNLLQRTQWISVYKAGFEVVEVNVPSIWPLHVTLKAAQDK